MEGIVDKSLNYFKKLYPHFDAVRTGETYVCDDKTLVVVPIVYRLGLSLSLAVVIVRAYKYRGVTHFDMAALDTKLQHIGNDWDLAQVKYFFDQQYGFTEFPCFAIGVNNDTTEGEGVEGDVLIIDPYSKQVVSVAKKVGHYARTGAFLGASVELVQTTNGWDCESMIQITCTNGCRYVVESVGVGTTLDEASWQADL